MLFVTNRFQNSCTVVEAGILREIKALFCIEVSRFRHAPSFAAADIGTMKHVPLPLLILFRMFPC